LIVISLGFNNEQKLPLIQSYTFVQLALTGYNSETISQYQENENNGGRAIGNNSAL